MPYVPRLKTQYHEDVVPTLKQRFGYGNVMEAPRVEKICINKGVGDAPENPKVLDDAVDELRRITGQQPSIRRAKKSVAAFNVRKGEPVGVKVTLRGARMYEFFDRLVTLALPRGRDFQGVPDRSFDGRGNYTLGIAEQIIFPEIDVDRVDRISGMDVTFVTSAETDEEAYALLKEMGMPFVRREEEGRREEREAREAREREEREAALKEAREEFGADEEEEETEEEEAEAAEEEAAEEAEAPA